MVVVSGEVVVNLETASNHRKREKQAEEVNTSNYTFIPMSLINESCVCVPKLKRGKMYPSKNSRRNFKKHWIMLGYIYIS